MKYFAYGSNMLTKRLTGRIRSAKRLETIYVPRYRLRFHKKSIDCSGKCNIIWTGCDRDVVHGVLYDVDDGQASCLDCIEGRDYERRKIFVLLDGTKTDVSTYFAVKDKIDDALVPYRWYYDLVLRGAEQHDLPIDYVAGLRAVPFTHDPKPDREERLKALEVLCSD